MAGLTPLDRVYQLNKLKRDLAAKSRGDTFPQSQPQSVLPTYGLHDDGKATARSRAADEALRAFGIRP